MAKSKKESTLVVGTPTLKLERKVKSASEIPLKTYEMKRNAFVGIKK